MRCHEINCLACLGCSSLVARLQVVWGNAKRNADGSVTCQHGPDECKNNILEGCAVVHYPETKQVRGCSHAQA